jgi:hypothetical protein
MLNGQKADFAESTSAALSSPSAPAGIKVRAILASIDHSGRKCPAVSHGESIPGNAGPGPAVLSSPLFESTDTANTLQSPQIHPAVSCLLLLFP